MSLKAKLQRFFLLSLIAVGLVPLLYFVTVEVQNVGASTAADSLADTIPPHERFVDNVSFGVGEKLTFDVNYGFINAGQAVMEVRDLVEYRERPCYQVVTTATSNDFFSTFYKVEDRVESIIDAEGIYTWRFEKNLREGNYSADRMYTFNQRENYVVDGKDTVAVPPVVQDALSALYFVRTQDLQVGTSVFVDNFTDGEQYALEVRVVKKETIDVDAGRFDCIVVEPLTQSVGVFRHEGRLKVWLTDDRLKMPVLMKSKVLVGSISAELTDFELGEIVSF